VITAVQKKHFRIEYNITLPDGSTPMDVIYASFALSIKKGPREEVAEERATTTTTTMMMTTIIKNDNKQ
jgi:hypothetical protein